MVKIDSVIHTNLQKKYSVICRLALSSSHDSTNFTLAPAWLSHWEISIFAASWDFSQISVYLMGGELTIWDLQDAETPVGKSVIVTLEYEPYNPLLVVALLRYIYKYHCKVTDHDQQEEREFWQMRYPISPPLCRYISLWIVVFPHDNDLSQTFVLGSQV